SVRLSSGGQVKFSAVDSQRVRLGAKVHSALNAEKTLSAYAGLAYEHEFDGKTKARIQTSTFIYKIDAPKLKGDSGVFELGLTLNPANNKPLTLDFGVQGYAGKREGITGSFRVNYRF
ncbi:MAG: autotransporter outer membrane beta-barrel domain-containing protein, partial [Candidatus Accumulibacter sp.]|nr:autotransporter outer membrane beta-barrel domain-containing protein [Accumulibacter sp.]